MQNLMTLLTRATLLIGVTWCCMANSAILVDTDIAQKGSYKLNHKYGSNKLVISISVTEPKQKIASKPIGNYNYLTALSFDLNGEKISIPKICKNNLLDINYVRLDDDKNIRFWIQGGDGSEAYQVAFSLLKNRAIKCQFFPEKNQF